VRALVLGEEAVARKVALAVERAHFGGAEVVGILTPPDSIATPEAAADGGPTIVGGYDDLSRLVSSLRIEKAIVVSGTREAHLRVDEVLSLRRSGLAVEDGTSLYEALTGRVLVEKLTPGWLIFANEFERGEFSRRVRRVIGAVLAGAALILLTPLFAVLALAIKLDSRGPVLFRQKRTGERGVVFDILKFRTMREDAEKETGAVWAGENDPRVTRVGRILRATRLDELPQLWNVWRGDMFFVGPRPERPEFVAKLSREVPYYAQRHAVKPGITGWAQINYRYGSTVEDAAVKLEYDLFYIQNVSLLLDLKIVIGTIRVVLGAGNRN
jgi:exopolysaccharide biosynthesis polyprenyl glycosylphosphotransferase